MSTAQATRLAIEKIPHITQEESSWIVGEWGEYEGALDEGWSEKFTFSADGTYINEVANSEITRTSGNWVVYSKEGSYRSFIFLYDNQDNIVLHALERVGTNTFRLILQHGNSLDRTSVYTRFNFTNDTDYSDPLVGEYQSLEDDNYMSINKIHGEYYVDLVSRSSVLGKFFQIEAEKLNENVLSFDLPEDTVGQNLYEGETITLEASNNRIHYINRENYGRTHVDVYSTYEKVTQYPVSQPYDLLGGWKNTATSASNYIKNIYFFNNGVYSSTNPRGGLFFGKYSLDDDTLTIKEECYDPEVYENISVDAKYLRMNSYSYYTPSPGLRDLGEEGAALGEIILKHAYDLYQRQYAPQFTSHPIYKGTYVFKNEVKFSDSSLVFHFYPDGSGSIFSSDFGNLQNSFTGEWVNFYQHDTSFSLKYFLITNETQPFF